MSDNVMREIERQANARFAAQLVAQKEKEKRSRAARRAKEEDRMRAVRAVQWRTRFSAVERKLVMLKNYLRYNPEDANLRRECEAVEQTYKELLEESG